MKTKRSKVLLGLHALTDTQTVAEGQSIYTMMTGNPDFVDPPSDLALLATQLATAQQTIDVYNSILAECELALTTRQIALADVRETLTRLGLYVETRSGGEENIILSAGMRVRADRLPVQMSQVLNLRVTPSENDGELIARWKRVRGARVYRVQICLDPTAKPGQA